MPFVKSAIYGVQIILTGFPKGDSPQSGEMSRRDKGDGRPLGDSPQSGEMSRRDKGDGRPLGDSPQCGEMSRRDKGDGRPFGGITLWQGAGDSLQCRVIPHSMGKCQLC